MIILTETTDNLQAVLDAVVTANQAQCITNWRDIQTTTYTPGRTIVQTNGATDVNVVPAPAGSTQRVVDTLVIHNADTVPHVLTLKLDANGTEYVVWKGTLGIGSALCYQDKFGFQVIDAGGAETLTNPATPVDIQSFNAEGIYLWTKPTTFVPKLCLIVCFGGGGGGGGGGSGTTGTTRTGGTGGGGGACIIHICRADLLGMTENVYVGNGGMGGPAGAAGGGAGGTGWGGRPTVFSMKNIPGSLYGNPSIETPGVSAADQQMTNGMIVACGGGGGFGGPAAATASAGGAGAGRASNGTNAASATATDGGLPGDGTWVASHGGVGVSGVSNADGGYGEYGGGAGGGHANTAASYAGGGSLHAAGGGGGGGGFAGGAPPTARDGAAGGASNTTASGTGGAAGTTGASPTVGTAGSAGKYTLGGHGGGGGGGNTAAGGAGAVGGAGGWPGGGGGGGGAGAGGGTGPGGNGGAGATGSVLVVTW